MRFIKQGENECFLASLCQLKKDLDFDALRKSYSCLWPGPVELAKKYNVGNVEALEKLSRSWVIIGSTGKVPAKGTGILIITKSIKKTAKNLKMVCSRHAVSYQDGWVLDPNGEGQKELLDDYLVRKTEPNIETDIEAYLPIKTEGVQDA